MILIQSRMVMAVFAMLCGMVGSAFGEASGEAFDPANIRSSLYRVYYYQTANPAISPERVSKHLPSDRNWVRGVYYTGIMALWEVTGNPRFLDQAVEWGHRHSWQVGHEGAGPNKLTCTQTYIELAMLRGKNEFAQPTIDWIASGEHNAPTLGKFWHGHGRNAPPYADGLYVGAPTLAMLYRMTGDTHYAELLDEHFWDVIEAIRDTDSGLVYRDTDYIPKRTANGKKILWARGNGWVFASIPRILRYLPADHPSRGRYIDLFREMADALVERQGDDGFWRMNLDDPEQFPMPESSGTAFFTYGLLWGINNDLLDRNEYLPAAEKGWQALYHVVSEEGKVQWGQRVAAHPFPIKKSDSEEYVSAAFFLAGSEMLKLVKSGAPDEAGKLLTTGALSADYPLAGTVETYLSRQENYDGFAPSGLTRENYLDVVEGQVRAFAKGQSDDGRIIDPVDQRERYYATPCYAHSVAALAAAGRLKNDPQLLESGMKALDVVTADLAAGQAANHHAEFYIWPTLQAYQLFAQLADAERSKHWKKQLSSLDRNSLYGSGPARDNNRNWNLVFLAGEYVRNKLGFDHDPAFIELSLAKQICHFTPFGMYDEHGNPMPYDAWTRYYLTGMLAEGYNGYLAGDVRDLLLRGAWTSLLTQSPFGEMPDSYRSSQHIWNEAELSALFEANAAAYAAAGKMKAAGAFKRGAHLALSSVRNWIRQDGSGYVVKNRYPAEAKHGYEAYSNHASYNLQACSMLSWAWQVADDSIAERPAPSDVGGYAVVLDGPFKKVFANVKGNYVQVDLDGDQHYNPTGLIRIHLKDSNPLIGPSNGCAEKFSGEGVKYAVGPSWQDMDGNWFKLAAFNGSRGDVRVLETSPDQVVFDVAYEVAGITIRETVSVDADGVTVEDELTGKEIQEMVIEYPMLVFDGRERTRIQMDGNSISLNLNGKGHAFSVLQPEGAVLTRHNREIKHRNGLMDVAQARFRSDRAKYRIKNNREQ